MTDTDGKKLIAMMLATWPQAAARMSPDDAAATAAAYRGFLADLDATLVARALVQLAATSSWLPTVAEIRKVAHELAHGAPRLAGEAWGDVVKAIGRWGMNRTPQLADPIAAYVVERMGWRELCESENAIADRARFIELYREVSARDRVAAIAGLASGPGPGLLGGGQ